MHPNTLRRGSRALALLWVLLGLSGSALAQAALAQIDAPRRVEDMGSDEEKAPVREPESGSEPEPAVSKPQPATRKPEPATREPEPFVAPLLRPHHGRDAGAAQTRAPDAGPHDIVVKPSPEGEKAPHPVVGASQPGVDPSRPPPKPLEVPKVGDADIGTVFKRWWTASEKGDRREEESAERQLFGLREDLAISDMNAIGASFMRASTRHLGKDNDAAVSTAFAATELAPSLPYTHLALAQAYLLQDPTAVAHLGGELRSAVEQMVLDPRFRRALIGDLGAAALFAWVATGIAVLAVLALRRARFLLHDIHHRFFPRAVARWQSGVLVLLVLALPLVLRSGLTVELLVILVALSLYLSWRERILGVLLLGTLGLLPLVAREWVEASAFAGSPAEDVYVLEQGGPEAQPVAERLRKRLEDSDLEFAELFALARYEQRRGQLGPAIVHFKQAARQRPGDARLLTNMGNALLSQGDAEGAADLYFSATQADPTLAAAFFNIARIHQRRAVVMRDDVVGLELERAQTALLTAQELDPSLLTRAEPPSDNALANRHLLAVPLPVSELEHLAGGREMGERVAAQLGSALLGNHSPEMNLIYPAALAALALLLGFGSKRGRLSRECQKCGRPVCRRCDPELGMGSELCNQCVHAFARKGALPAAVAVRKQIEVRRYQSRHEKISYGLGLFVSGLGHLFNGYTLRGALYAFLFLFTVFCVYLREGLIRAPYAWVPTPLKLLPLGLLFAFVYGMSLRGLRRHLNP